MPFMDVIFPPQRAGRRKESESDWKENCFFDLLQVIKLSIVILPLTINKTDHNCVLLDYWWDTEGSDRGESTC